MPESVHLSGIMLQRSDAEVSIMPSEALRPGSRPVLVRLPALLVSLFPLAERRVELCVETVDQMIDALETRWPGMRDCLCDSTPAIRRHINIFVEGRRATLATRLVAGADVFILTAISGG
jgi:molybdopterin synthase sulfur carrier subunit